MPIEACTKALMEVEGSIEAMARKHKRARRARSTDGRRKKCQSRRQRAAQSALSHEAELDLCPPTGHLGDTWWPQFGMWAIDTGNGNSWGTLHAAVAKRSKADILLGQESKIFTQNGIRSAQSEARACGWNPTFSTAHPTACNLGSGGNMVFARKGTGITPHLNVGIPDGTAHRIHLAWVDAVLRGGLHCMSIYLRHSEGLSEANMCILEVATVALRCLKGPWVAAGDWNMSPQTLAQSRWLEQVDGIIFATELTTCNDSTYDFFVVHRSIAKAVVGVQRLEDAGMNPHSPSRLILRGDARRHAVRKLVRPPKVEPLLPSGPSRPPPSYEQVHLLAGSADSLGEAMEAWYSTARQEFGDLAGKTLGHFRSDFKWGSPVAIVRQPWAGTTEVSSMWRNLAMRAAEASKILHRTEVGSPTPVVVLNHSHAAHLASNSLCKSARAEVQQAVDAWAKAFDNALHNASPHWMHSLHTLAVIRASKLEDQVACSRIKAWRSRIGALPPEMGGAKAPTKAAYRWVKGTNGWRPSQIGAIEANDAVPMEDDCPEGIESGIGQVVPSSGSMQEVGRIPLSDQAAVDIEAEKWAALWLEKEKYTQPSYGLSSEALEQLMPNAVVIAATSFPIGTGLGADNISPRAITRLSAAGICALAALFMAFEAKGDWCQVLNLVLIVLLPKSDGGLRPIGLFPTVIRLWFRTRIGLARAWEQTHSLPCVFGGVGSSAQHAAWQAAFVAESAALCSLDHVQALLDLVKAFETVPHHILVMAAIAKGYPIAILRLSLAAHRLTRAVGIEGVFSRAIVASRGIAAGSGFATAELKMLLHDTMGELHSRWAHELTIRLFVDDLTVAACGAPRAVVALMVKVLNFLIHQLEEVLKMQVSGTKSKVLAGRPALAQAVAMGIVTKKISVTKHAKLLGTDSAGGRRRSTVVAAQRLQDFIDLIPRFQALRRLGVNSRQMVRAAGPPAILYGCDVMGVCDSVLHTARTRIAAAVAPQAGGKSPDLVLYITDGLDGTLDPAFQAHSEPTKMWATAWWEQWFTHEQLCAAFAEASIKLASRSDLWWQRAAGPVAALVASLRRIGWSMPSATEAIDDCGMSWQFGTDSPAAIVKAVQQAVRRWRLNRIADLLPGLVPDAPDIQPTYTNQPMRLVDFSHVLAPLVHGRGAAGRVSDDWSPARKGELASACTGGQWTQARRAQVPAWNIDDNRCQLCLQATGTLEHRLRCATTTPEGGWPQPPPKARLALQKLSANRLRLLQTRALLVLKVPIMRPKLEGDLEWLLEPDFNDPIMDEAMRTSTAKWANQAMEYRTGNGIPHRQMEYRTKPWNTAPIFTTPEYRTAKWANQAMRTRHSTKCVHIVQGVGIECSLAR